jgi:hypothetical protein
MQKNLFSKEVMKGKDARRYVELSIDRGNSSGTRRLTIKAF